MLVYFNGLILGLSLIMSLGPQNIFVIRQGAMRKHAVLTAITCFFCDLILITASVIGLQTVLEIHPYLRSGLTYIGVAFLLYYGLSTLNSAIKRNAANADEKSEHQLLNRWQIILLALGFSLLNPHAIIDSLVLIGGGSSQYPGHQKEFLLGVLSSSFVWFTLLTATTYYFAHILTREVVWRRIEFFSAGLMFYISIKLLMTVW